MLAQQRGGHQPPRRRLEQLEGLGLPAAPLQWAAAAQPAGQLIQAWRPWRLLSALAAQPFGASVQGLAVALEPEGSELHIKARLDLG